MIENNNKTQEKIKENKIKETKFSSVLLFIGLGILILIVRFTMTIFNKNDYYNKWIKKALDRYNSVYVPDAVSRDKIVRSATAREKIIVRRFSQ